MTERFPAIALQDMTEAQRVVRDEICAGPRGDLIGPFLVLLHAPGLETCIHRVGEYLRFGCTLPKDVIELVVLVTAHRWKCHFEWVIHAPIGLSKGLSEDTVRSLREGQRPASMTPAQAAAWHVATDVHRNGEASDAAFDAANQHFGREGVLELVGLCGYYSTLAMILNTARFMPPEGPVWERDAPSGAKG